MQLNWLLDQVNGSMLTNFSGRNQGGLMPVSKHHKVDSNNKMITSHTSWKRNRNITKATAIVAEKDKIRKEREQETIKEIDKEVKLLNMPSKKQSEQSKMTEITGKVKSFFSRKGNR